MVQTLLIFALGFLSAAFVAVAAAPAIWARAVALTRRRIEASVPLTLNELQADKDQQRAEFAMTVRKLEIGVKSTREKLTMAQVEAEGLKGDKQMLISERDLLNAKTSEQEQLLKDRAEQVAVLEAKHTDLVKMVEDSASEIHDKELHINNLMIDADSYRIELAAKVTELERLAGEISEVKNARSAVEQNLRSTANQLRASQEAERGDRRRIAELEKKTDRLIAQMTDRDDRLERREKDVERLKEQVKLLTSERNELERRFATTERQRAHLEHQNSGLAQRMTKLTSIATPATADKTIKALESERNKLLETVEKLTRETAALREMTRQPVEIARTAMSGNELLRDKIHELTAKVVKMTADQEGSASPIPALLGKADRKATNGGRVQELPVSLADRIRALEHTARRG